MEKLLRGDSCPYRTETTEAGGKRCVKCEYFGGPVKGESDRFYCDYKATHPEKPSESTPEVDSQNKPLGEGTQVPYELETGKGFTTTCHRVQGRAQVGDSGCVRCSHFRSKDLDKRVVYCAWQDLDSVEKTTKSEMSVEEALNYAKSACEKFGGTCDDCPFLDQNEGCLLDSAPDEYNLEALLKAFAKPAAKTTKEETHTQAGDSLEKILRQELPLKERLDIEGHYLNKGDIQYQLVGSSPEEGEEWLPLEGDPEDFYFRWDQNNYRKAPKVTLRPWTATEVVQHREHWFRIKHDIDANIFRVQSIREGTIRFRDRGTFHDAEVLLRHWELVDPDTGETKPCGVEVTK